MPGVRAGLSLRRSVRAHRGAGTRSDRTKVQTAAADAAPAQSLLQKDHRPLWPAALHGPADALLPAIRPASSPAEDRLAETFWSRPSPPLGAPDRQRIFLRPDRQGLSRSLRAPGQGSLSCRLY